MKTGQVCSVTIVKLEIFNIRGQKVKTLTDGSYAKGRYTLLWNGQNEIGKTVSSGVYFYRLSAGGKSISRKMLMLK